MFIAAAYLVSFPLGLATTIAVVAHEIPQEIGDYSILIRAGFGKRKALFYNYLSAATSFLGVFIVFWIGKNSGGITNFILPVAAGGFLYLAGSDLMPDLHREQKLSSSLFEFLWLVLGAALLFFLTFLD
jgi:zinc and cadmium transporter